jgi:hypothetical protein
MIYEIELLRVESENMQRVVCARKLAVKRASKLTKLHFIQSNMSFVIHLYTYVCTAPAAANTNVNALNSSYATVLAYSGNIMFQN